MISPPQVCWAIGGEFARGGLRATGVFVPGDPQEPYRKEVTRRATPGKSYLRVPGDPQEPYRKEVMRRVTPGWSYLRVPGHPRATPG
eukprot:8367852-Pyramimonas_sp.AAC.1